jgi:bifunctional oligoribonuclease and PAP phosphatase NrnA
MPVKSVPETFLETFLSFDHYLVTGHEDPDGDCLGSQLALTSFLLRKGKRAWALSPGPFQRGEINDLEPRFESEVPGDFRREEQGERKVVVLLDCSGIDRTGRLAKELEGYPLIIIDHHATARAGTAPAFIDSTAPSVTYLVLLLLEAAGAVPGEEEAQLLLFGLATDTGFFRHVSGGGSETFSVVSRLCGYGANPKEAFGKMYGNRTLASRRLAGRVIDRAQLHHHSKIVTTYLTMKDEEELGKGERDSDTIYGQLQSISGVDAVFFFREEEEGKISVGLRSNKDLDTGTLASLFGGGGHKHAASFRSSTSMEALEKELLQAAGAQYSRFC